MLFSQPVLKTEGKGVIVVDMQGDFTTWKNGSLAVEGADESYVKNVEEVTKKLARAGFLTIATQDWHPPEHISFYTNHPGKNPFEVIEIEGRTQVLWPPHCVQGTENAEVLVDNDLFIYIVKKGQDPRFDSYSGFKDDGGQETGLDEVLKKNGISELIIYGLATDYCVKATAIDAVEIGYKVSVVEPLCRAVSPETAKDAGEEMRNKGINVIKELDELFEKTEIN